MGKGRDKRKKKEDPAKAAQRHARQQLKLNKNADKGKGGDEPQGFNNEEAIEVTLKKLQKVDNKVRTIEEVQDVPPPSPRCNVVFVAHPCRPGELLLFGGEFWNGEATEAYNDTYFYHTKKQKWARLLTAVKPAPRSSCQGVVYKHLLVIFGGEFVSQTQSQFHHFRDVWRYDSQRSEWEELKGLKGGPSSRSGHRMALWKRSAVVFGGFYDNAMESHYYNDVWLLSHMEGAGRWERITIAGGEEPHARSGHCMAVYKDTLFVYGGYSTEKFNRFKKSEATVHHDLWMLPLPSEVSPESRALESRWVRVKLGGIPPPIRSGVSATFKDKKLYLFGGVTDVESPGGKLVSTFSNDLFVFHMDTKRFFPVVLHKKAGKAAKAESPEERSKRQVNELKAELAALNIVLSSSSSSGDDDDEEEEEDEDGEGGNTHATDSQQKKESYEERRNGQIFPHRRMDAATALCGNQLFVFGGQFESGEKEITMADLFALNLNRLDTYEVLLSQDLSAAVWLGKESESAGSWESGSTVVSNAFDFDLDDDDDDDDDDEDGEGGAARPGDFSRMPRQQELGPGDDDDENPPDAIPAEFHVDVTPSRFELMAAAASAVPEVDGLKTKGKKGLQAHKEQLKAQLSAAAAVPTPQRDETFANFFARTKAFWEETAIESSGESKLSARRLAKEANSFARMRYTEAKELLEQLRLVEEREREEAKFFRERQLQKEKEWAEYEEQLRREAAEEEEEKKAKQVKKDDEGEDSEDDAEEESEEDKD